MELDRSYEMLRLDLYESIARERQQQLLEQIRVNSQLRQRDSASGPASPSRPKASGRPQLDPRPARG